MKKFVSLVLLVCICLCSYSCYATANEHSKVMARIKKVDEIYSIVVGQTWLLNSYGGGVDGLMIDPEISDDIAEAIRIKAIELEQTFDSLLHNGVPVDQQDWSMHWRIREGWEKELNIVPSIPSLDWPGVPFPVDYGPPINVWGDPIELQTIQHDYIDSDGFLHRTVSKEEFKKYYNPKVIPQHAAPTSSSTPLEYKTIDPTIALPPSNALYPFPLDQGFVFPKQNNYKRYVVVQISVVINGEIVTLDDELYETEDGKWVETRDYRIFYQRVDSAPNLQLPPGMTIKKD